MIPLESAVLEMLSNGDGFYITPKINDSELNRLWSHVINGYKGNLELKSANKECMLNHHTNSTVQEKFSKLSVFDRTLDKDMALDICERPWLRKLSNELGYFPVDSYGLGHPSFTWRLMRPGQSNDLRGVHRDAWFRYALNEPVVIDKGMPAQLQTIKAWIALNVEPGNSGLLVSPCSQNESTPGFTVVHRDGLTKPAVNESEAGNLKFIHAQTDNGSIVLFGEQLMHGGAPTKTDTARISLEFTLARPQQNYYQTFISPNGAKTNIDFINSNNSKP